MAWSELQPLILQFYKQIYTDFFKNRDRFKFCVNKKNDIKATIDMSSRTVSASPAAAYKSDNLSKKISPIMNKSASSPDGGLSISKAFTLSHVLKFTNILTRSIYPL